MELDIFKVIGVLGLLSIITGTFIISIKGRVRKRHVYSFLLLGGICLAIYSFYIKDLIFILLQIVYILIVIYDILKLKMRMKK